MLVIKVCIYLEYCVTFIRTVLVSELINVILQKVFRAATYFLLSFFSLFKLEPSINIIIKCLPAQKYLIIVDSWFLAYWKMFLSALEIPRF